MNSRRPTLQQTFRFFKSSIGVFSHTLTPIRKSGNRVHDRGVVPLPSKVVDESGRRKDEQRSVILPAICAESSRARQNLRLQMLRRGRATFLKELNQPRIAKFLVLSIRSFGDAIGVEYEPVPGSQLHCPILKT